MPGPTLFRLWEGPAEALLVGDFPLEKVASWIEHSSPDIAGRHSAISNMPYTPADYKGFGRDGRHKGLTNRSGSQTL